MNCLVTRTVQQSAPRRGTRALGANRNLIPVHEEMLDPWPSDHIATLQPNSLVRSEDLEAISGR